MALLNIGTANLAREHNVRPREGYADECHMCYEVRRELRTRGELKEVLVPDQSYGVTHDDDSTK